MKKIFLTSFLYFVSLGFVFAQIGELTPVEQHLDIKRVLKNVWMVYDKSDNTYCLKIDSDNEYEDQYALLLLGKGENEALQSLINLYKALQQPDNILMYKSTKSLHLP